MEGINPRLEPSPWPSTSAVHDPYTFDVAHYTQILHDHSKRLFVQDTQVWVKIIEVGTQEVLFKSFPDLNIYLETSQFKGTRIILVPQRFSWDHLMISDQGMRKLLSHFQIFPAILDVVQAFGGQTSSESDSVSACHSHTRGAISEYCYIAKHVEEHGREESTDPWSIRQMGVYHQCDLQLDTHTFIIFNPSKTFQQRLKDAQASTGTPPTWKDIHRLAASCSTTLWRGYISYMESQLARLKTKAHLSAVDDPDRLDQKPKLKIEFEDTQNIQVVNDKLHTVHHILDSNLRVFTMISSLLNGPLAVQAQLPSRQLNASGSGLAFCTAEMEAQIQRLSTLFERINAASGLMQNIIDFRALEALKTSSAMSTEISRLAQSDNKLMLANAEKSQKDARTLTTITIFTMIYLPASFVSFLSMGYISLGSTDNHVSLKFANEMWIFGVMTLVFLAVTIGSWLWLEMRSRRAAKKIDCEARGES